MMFVENNIKYSPIKNNNLLAKCPELLYEWDFTRNSEEGLFIEDISYGSNKKVFWIGKCGHKWETSVKSRTSKGQGCPYCSNNRILVGFNDLQTTNPDLAKWLLNPEDGYKYTEMSGQRVDWRCLECGEIIRDKIISAYAIRGVSCPICSDHISFPEKFMISFLKYFGISFETEKVFEWSDDKRYDFYLKDLNMIIEMHGGQHYVEGFIRAGGKSLEDVKKNDLFKKNNALNNGISKYLIIDSRESTAEYIKNSINESTLSEIFPLDEVDWEHVSEEASCSIAKKIWDLWNSGMKSMSEISREVNVGKQAVRRYVKRGVESGKCIYTGREGYENREHRFDNPVVQLNSDGSFVKRWENLWEVENVLGHVPYTVYDCVRGKKNSSYGYIWLSDKIYQSEKREEVVKKRVEVFKQWITKGRAVIQSDLKGNILNIFPTITKASESTGVSKAIIDNRCRKFEGIHGEYKWSFKQDYEEKYGVIEE